MYFASLPPWWLTVVAVLAVAAVVFFSYRRSLAPLAPARRATLVAMRAATLLMLLLLVFRPVGLAPPSAIASRSCRWSWTSRKACGSRMRTGPRERHGPPRCCATNCCRYCRASIRTELLTAGAALEPGSIDGLAPRAGQSDLAGAIAPCAIVSAASAWRGWSCCLTAPTPGHRCRRTGRARQVFPGRSLPLALDPRPGCTIAKCGASRRVSAARPCVGGLAGVRGQQRVRSPAFFIAGARRWTAAREPAARAVGRRFAIEQRFTVFPDSRQPTVYTAEIPAGDGEPITENNTRSVLVSPAGRKRRLLVIEGAPGFEHTFVRRAWTADAGLEVDSVVRKGKDVNGSNTFLIQAEGSRASSLAGGFPARREDLYAYDAVVISNVEGGFFDARTADDGCRLRVRTRWRPPRDRWPIVCATGHGRHSDSKRCCRSSWMNAAAA